MARKEKVRYTARKLELFKLNARTADGPVDYALLFKTIAETAEQKRFSISEKQLTAMPTFSVSGTSVFFVVYEGDLGVHPLIFDSTAAKARVERLKSAEVLATKTHGMIDLKTREAVVEYNHRGAKAYDVQKLLYEVSRKHSAFEDIELDLNPVVDDNFLDALKKFERIRIATIRVARPNFDWTDFRNKITDAAAESNAQNVELIASAPYRQSLSLKQGVVKFVKDSIATGAAVLRGARIIGRREGETAETSISLNKYVTHQKVRVKETEDGYPDEENMKEKMRNYLDSRAEKQQKERGHRK